MNLTERLGQKRLLWCPFADAGACVVNECAHYNPETDECIHVEAARAQVEAAKELSVIAQTLECETINICRRG